jgi:hypothetical protein
MTCRVFKIIPVSNRYEGQLEDNVQGAKAILSDGREISMEAKAT